jgi:hypothetical protein
MHPYLNNEIDGGSFGEFIDAIRIRKRVESGIGKK